MLKAEKPELVIFDMDGVLVNSEAAFRRACSEVLVQWGIHADYDEFRPFTGMGDAKYIGGVSEKYGVSYVPEMTERSYNLYAQYAPKLLKVFDWSREVLCSLHDAGVKIALASSAGAFKVGVNLDCIGAGRDIFSAIITGNDVDRKKPAPDIFLAAAEKVGIPPERCLVAEDAVSGVTAAKAAGMTCAAVTTSFGENELRAAGADLICRDLREMPEHYYGIITGKRNI